MEDMVEEFFLRDTPESLKQFRYDDDFMALCSAVYAVADGSPDEVSETEKVNPNAVDWPRANEVVAALGLHDAVEETKAFLASDVDVSRCRHMSGNCPCSGVRMSVRSFLNRN